MPGLNVIAPVEPTVNVPPLEPVTLAPTLPATPLTALTVSVSPSGSVSLVITLPDAVAFSVVEFVLALSSLAFGYGQGSAHDARHLSSFAVAVAVGLVYAAWHPSRSAGVLAVVATLVAAMTASAGVELVEGRTTWLAEAHHVLELSALGSLWALAGFPHPSLRRFSRSLTHRAVPDDR